MYCFHIFLHYLCTILLCLVLIYIHLTVRVIIKSYYHQTNSIKFSVRGLQFHFCSLFGVLKQVYSFSLQNIIYIIYILISFCDYQKSTLAQIIQILKLVIYLNITFYSRVSRLIYFRCSSRPVNWQKMKIWREWVHFPTYRLTISHWHSLKVGAKNTHHLYRRFTCRISRSDSFNFECSRVFSLCWLNLLFVFIFTIDKIFDVRFNLFTTIMNVGFVKHHANEMSNKKVLPALNFFRTT